MPRAFSSFRRSGSVPVSARTSELLPWSIWPAVPTMAKVGFTDDTLSGRWVSIIPRGDHRDPLRSISVSRGYGGGNRGTGRYEVAASSDAARGPGRETRPTYKIVRTY